MIKKILPVILPFALLACNPTEFDTMDVSGLMGEKIEATYTIQQLKSEYISDPKSLFSAEKIDTIDDVVINGIITSTDVEGNVYKYLTIQEETPGGQAIKLSVDVSGLSSMYPLGQRVSVRLNDLYIGNYAQSPQIGVYLENTERNRIEPGRMPRMYARQQIIQYGIPYPRAIIPDTMTIAQIRASRDEMVNKIVVIKNAYFTGRGSGSNKQPELLSDAELIFAPSTNGVGYPQSREIQDGTGSVFVSTSEYSKFAAKPLPLSKYKGEITAIIGWYNDKDASERAGSIYHQLTLRTIKDLGKGFEAYHESLK